MPRRSYSRDVARPLVLAFDIGTSSLRTALFDHRGHRCADTTAQLKYRVHVSGDGAAELAPGTFLNAARTCLKETLRLYRRAAALHGRPIVAVGTSCFWHSMVGVDAKGKPLTPIITWADSRCRDDAQRLREKLSERAVHRRTGCMLRASFWPAKLVWLRRTQGKQFRAVKRWMSPAEWLYEQFCGEGRCGFSMASGTGLLDVRTLKWDAAMLKEVGLDPATLNPLSDEPLTLKTGLRRTFPELSDAAWVPALGDGAASNVGSGATEPGLAAINVGTSAAVRVVARGKRVAVPFGLFAYRVDAQRLLIGGAVSNAGNLRQWCVEQLQPEGGNATAIETELASRPTPAHGLTVLPFWVSERAPTWPEGMPSAILGGTPATTAMDLLQAATEATYLRIAQIAEELPQPVQGRNTFIVSGGIQHSASSMRRLANCLGAPVRACAEAEASLRGGAVFALEKVGLKGDALPHGKAIRQQAAAVKAYREQRAKQATLEQVLSAWKETGR